jgi:hypothetical protein
VREQIGILHRRLLAIIRNDAVCRRLMTVPGVGLYRVTVDVPATPLCCNCRSPRLTTSEIFTIYFIDTYIARSFQHDSQTPRCSFHSGLPTVLHQPRLKFCTGFLLAGIDPVRIWV